MEQHDDSLIRALADVPAVPDSLYAGVTGRIAGRARLVRTVWALAACVMLAVGLGGYRALAPHPAVVADEATQELQDLSAFVNGTTVEQDIDVYAVADELF
jgi:hypothetical protein